MSVRTSSRKPRGFHRMLKDAFEGKRGFREPFIYGSRPAPRARLETPRPR